MLSRAANSRSFGSFAPIDTLQQIQDVFAESTKVASIIMSMDGEWLTQPSGMSRFCSMIRDSDAGRNLCRECDFQHALGAEKEDSPTIYRCHAGIIDFVAPIEVSGRIVAAIFGGQVLRIDNDWEESERIAKDLAGRLGINVGEFMEALHELPQKSEEEIEDTVRLMQHVANAISQIAFQEKALLDRLGALTRIAESANSAEDLNEILKVVRQELVRVIGDDKNIGIFLLDDAASKLVLREYYHPDYAPPLQSGFEIEVGKGIVGTTAQNKKPYLAPDVSKDENYLTIVEQTKSELAVPILYKSFLIGVMNVESLYLSDFDSRDQEFLMIVAGQTAAAISNIRFVDEIKRDMEFSERMVENILSSSGSDRILDDIIDRAIEVTNSDKGYILSGKKGKDILDLVKHRNLDKKEMEFTRNIRDGVWGLAIQYNTPITMTRSETKENYFIDITDESDMNSVLCIPIRTQELITVLLALYNHQRDFYTEEHLSKVKVLINEAVLALLYDELRQEATSKMRLMSEITFAINRSAFDTDYILNTAIKELVALLEAEVGSIMLLDDGGEELFIAAQVGIAEDRISNTIKLGNGIIGSVAKEGRTIRVPNVRKDSRYFPWHPDVVSKISVPIKHEPEDVLGVIDIGSTEYNYFTLDDESLLETISDQIAIALRKARLLEDLQEEQERKEKSLENLSRNSQMLMSAEIANTIIHDIGNSASAISFAIDELRRNRKLKNIGDKNIERQLSILEEETDGISDLVDTIKNFAKGQRIESKQDINRIIEEAVDLLQDSFKRRGLTINFRAAKGLPPIVCSDIEMMQVFVNIMQNSGDAMEGRRGSGRTLSIKTRFDDQNVIIEFDDEGEGIPPENMSKIFLPLFTTKSSRGGTGLGLPSVKRIVEQNCRGTVDVKSSLGKGTSLTIRLPRQRRAI